MRRYEAHAFSSGVGASVVKDQVKHGKLPG
jgi:hypothetical protein